MHLLYSCSLHRGPRSRRHAQVQRVYEQIAQQAGLTVSKDAPDVTPIAEQHTNHKKEYGDWSVYDSKIGKTVIFDNSCFNPHTQHAKKLAHKQCGEEKFFGQSALIPAAGERRRVKHEQKGAGCIDRGQLFLPLINSSAGAFIHVAEQTSSAQGDHQEQLFDSADTGAGAHHKRPPEVALIRRWARRVADVKEGGKGVFDATLAVDSAAGLMVSSIYKQIAFAATRESSNAVILAIHRNGLCFDL